MWTDYYLIMPDREAYDALRAEVEAQAAVVDDIGTLYRSDSGEASNGYHVNVRMPEGEPLPAGALGFVIAPPALPKRIFMP